MCGKVWGHGCKEESKLELPGHLCHQASRPSLKVKRKDGDEREREMPDAAGVKESSTQSRYGPWPALLAHTFLYFFL